MRTMTAIVGIDIAKDKFDVCLVAAEGQRHQETFANTRSGINKLHTWLKKRGAKTAHVCLEATGIYGELVAETLHQRGYRVSVVNPARIKAYAASQMQRNKTDALDAALIAEYCRTQPPRSEEHTSELQSQSNLVCRLLLDTKKATSTAPISGQRRHMTELGAPGMLTA